MVLAVHWPKLKPQEWRILVQVTVLGWAINAIFLRMHWVDADLHYDLINRILAWTMLATTLCHSLYYVIKSFIGAMIVGAVWGVAYFILPMVSQHILTTSSWSLLLMEAAMSGMLALLIFSFVIQTRIFNERQNYG